MSDFSSFLNPLQLCFIHPQLNNSHTKQLLMNETPKQWLSHQRKVSSLTSCLAPHLGLALTSSLVFFTIQRSQSWTLVSNTPSLTCSSPFCHQDLLSSQSRQQILLLPFPRPFPSTTAPSLNACNYYSFYNNPSRTVIQISLYIVWRPRPRLITFLCPTFNTYCDVSEVRAQ